MPRIRSIKPEFWASESLGTRLPGAEGRQARLLFIALWNHAEDHGVCRAAPALLRSVAFPYDEDVTAADVSRWLGMLEAGRFIVRYERDGSSYLWVRAFDEHQKIDRKSKTSLPEPSNHEKQSALSGFHSVASTRRALDEHSLQEGKGREGRGEDLSASRSAGAEASGEDLPDATEHAHPAERPQLVLEPSPSDAPPEEPKKRERRLSAAEELYAAIQRARRVRCEDTAEPFVEDRWDNARQNKNLGPVAKGSAEERKRFEGAFGEFLADEQWKPKGWPLSLFMSGAVRSRYEKQALDAEKGAA